MTDAQIKKLARKIARELFTTPAGNPILRLDIALPPIHPGMKARDGGDWTEAAVIALVEKALRE